MRPKKQLGPDDLPNQIATNLGDPSVLTARSALIVLDSTSGHCQLRRSVSTLGEMAASATLLHCICHIAPMPSVRIFSREVSLLRFSRRENVQ
jgi:hypothetical protein